MTCPQCNGTGIRASHQLPGSPYDSVRLRCLRCHGTGRASWWRTVALPAIALGAVPQRGGHRRPVRAT